jgi:hypothetical protein
VPYWQTFDNNQKKNDFCVLQIHSMQEGEDHSTKKQDGTLQDSRAAFDRQLAGHCPSQKAMPEYTSHHTEYQREFTFIRNQIERQARLKKENNRDHFEMDRAQLENALQLRSHSQNREQRRKELGITNRELNKKQA